MRPILFITTTHPQVLHFIRDPGVWNAKEDKNVFFLFFKHCMCVGTIYSNEKCNDQIFNGSNLLRLPYLSLWPFFYSLSFRIYFIRFATLTCIVLAHKSTGKVNPLLFCSVQDRDSEISWVLRAPPVMPYKN